MQEVALYLQLDNGPCMFIAASSLSELKRRWIQGSHTHLCRTHAFVSIWMGRSCLSRERSGHGSTSLSWCWSS